uniref:BUD13 homolog n=1 Tax=Trichogramma kaykai TaxID=54128 RepID=A0ABD2X6Q8_9HYME
MSKLQQDLKEMDKPLARYADDEDLEKELKSRDRDDDPMLAFIKEKEIKEGKRAPSYILAHLCPKGLVLNQVSNGMEWTEVMGMKTNGLNSKTRRKQLKKKLTSGVLQTCVLKFDVNQKQGYNASLFGATTGSTYTRHCKKISA